MDTNLKCPLCLSSEVAHFAIVKTKYDRKFYKCESCNLIFCDPSLKLSPDEEKNRYSQHNNDKLTAGYEKFLRSLLDPVLDLVNDKMKGLDFGSGPYPMMVELAKNDGVELDYYDPFFAPNNEVLTGSYDYILCCEVVEHFNFPKEGFEQMLSLLKPLGLLAIKTSLFDFKSDFVNWHYVQDETHVSIYSEETIHWLVNRYNLQIKYLEKNVIIFKVL